MIQFPGVQVGPFRIVRKAPGGDGGMGDVFVANDSRTERMVALKLVPLGDDREAQEVVEAERSGAHFQQQLWEKFRQVPEVYEFGTDGGYFYIAMELLDGENLSSVITAGALGPERAVGIALQVCRFLEAAHSLAPVVNGDPRRSLVHGDLKPRNIRILENDAVKVFDFGIAKALSFSRKVTRNDFGSLAYLSPERIHSGDINEHADLWALGVILDQMLSGAQPFQDRNTRQLEARICSRRPPPPLDEQHPLGLRAITAKLLAGEQAERYSDAAAVRADLELVAAGQATLAECEGWPARALDEPPTQRVHAVPPVPDEATRRTSIAPARAELVQPSVWSRIKRFSTSTGGFAASALRLLVLLAVLNELRVMWSANRLTAATPAQTLTDLNSAWQRHDALTAWSLHLGSIGLERALVRQTRTLAETVFADYRSPSPSVREAQWKLTRDALSRAAWAYGGDDDIRGALRYVEGQLHRIDGEARKARRQNADAQRELSAAVTSFRAAADLRPEWPDPYLGLMRTYIAGLDDVERGIEALGQARRLGYAPSDRDTAQLADGHRVRAEALVRAARAVAGLAQELQYFTQAAEEYRQAIDFYSTIPSYGDSIKSLRAAQRSLIAVEERIASLEDDSRPSGVEGRARPEAKSRTAARSWAATS